MTATRSPQEADGELVTVHLAEVPEKLRVHVAERLVRVYRLEGPEAILLKMAALAPLQNPSIEVTRAEARVMDRWR